MGAASLCAEPLVIQATAYASDCGRVRSLAGDPDQPTGLQQMLFVMGSLLIDFLIPIDLRNLEY